VCLYIYIYNPNLHKKIKKKYEHKREEG
jgi:hypothetical protein